MEYQAKLWGVHGLEKPRVSYSASIQVLRKWAKDILVIHPTGWVSIYYVTTVMMERITPELDDKGKVTGIVIKDVK